MTTSPTSDDQSASPAARRKSATRARLSEQAVEVFASRGFDQATVAEIAAQAGVTERTFFNHFPSKVDAIFLREEYNSFASLQQLISEQPTAMSDVEALVRCGLDWLVADLDADPIRHHHTGRLRQQISETSSAVMGIRAATQERMTNAMIDGLAQRRGRTTPVTTEVAIGVAVAAVLHRAFIQWVEGDDPYAFEHVACELLSQFFDSVSQAPPAHEWITERLDLS